MHKFIFVFVLLPLFGSAHEAARALNADDKKQIDKQIEDFFMRNPEKLEQTQ